MTSDAPDEPVVLLWRDIASAVQRTQRGIDQALEGSGVSAQEFAVLSLLLHATEHRAPMNVLAREVLMTSGGFTKLADRMARDGLIDRRGSDDDRRVIRAVLTSEGEQRARRAAETYVRILHAYLLDALSLSELATVAAIVSRLAPGAVDPIDTADEFTAAPRRSTQYERRARPAPGSP